MNTRDRLLAIYKKDLDMMLAQARSHSAEDIKECWSGSDMFTITRFIDGSYLKFTVRNCAVIAAD